MRPGRSQGVDQVADGIAFGKSCLGLMHRDTGQALLAMNILGIDRCAHQRLRRTGIDRHVFAPCPLTGQPRIARGLVQTHVTGHGGQRANVQGLRRSQCKQQRHHVVGTRVGIDDQVDFLRRVGACSSEQGQKQQAPDQVRQSLSIAMHSALLVRG
ncbi:hypothetical protein D3C73_1270310 [compost metagenome]